MARFGGFALVGTVPIENQSHDHVMRGASSAKLYLRFAIDSYEMSRQIWTRLLPGIHYVDMFGQRSRGDFVKFGLVFATLSGYDPIFTLF